MVRTYINSIQNLNFFQISFAITICQNYSVTNIRPNKICELQQVLVENFLASDILSGKLPSDKIWMAKMYAVNFLWLNFSFEISRSKIFNGKIYSDFKLTKLLWLLHVFASILIFSVSIFLAQLAS